MKRSLALLCLLLLTACEPTTAAQRVTNATDAPAARQTQFAADTWATVTARAIQADADRAVAQGTAIAAQSTQVALVAQQTADARAVATATVRAERQAATATAQAAQQATSTASVQATRTALELRVQASAAERDELLNRWGTAFLAILAAVCIWSLYALMRAAYRRAQLVHYGPARNPLVLLPNGAVYNPVSNTWSGDEIPAELQARLQTGLVELLAIQAQHNPHPPVKPELAKSSEWHVGPVGAKASSGPPLVFEKPPAPTLPKTTPPAKIEAPDKPVHYMYLQGQAISEADRELMDLREFLERGAQAGFTRDGTWLGYQFASGHTCNKPQYYRLRDILVAAGVIVADGNTYKLAVPLEQALAACNLENVRLD